MKKKKKKAKKKIFEKTNLATRRNFHKPKWGSDSTMALMDLPIPPYSGRSCMLMYWWKVVGGGVESGVVVDSVVESGVVVDVVMVKTEEL